MHLTSRGGGGLFPSVCPSVCFLDGEIRDKRAGVFRGREVLGGWIGLS